MDTHTHTHTPKRPRDFIVKALFAVVALISLSTSLARAQEYSALVSNPLGSARAYLYSGYDEFFFMLRAEIGGSIDGTGYMNDCYFLSVGPLNVTVTRANGSFSDANNVVDRNYRPWISGDRRCTMFNYAYNLSEYGYYIGGNLIDSKSGEWVVPYSMYVGNNVSY